MSRPFLYNFSLFLSCTGAALASQADLGLEMTTYMPCTVRSVDVRPGDHVTAGQTLFTLEAMKMLITVAAPREGYVGDIPIEVNTTLPSRHQLTRLYNAPPRFEPTPTLPPQVVLAATSAPVILPQVVLEETIPTVSPREAVVEEAPVIMTPYVSVEVLDPMESVASTPQDTLFSQMEDVIEDDDAEELPTPFDTPPPDAPEPIQHGHIPWQGTSFVSLVGFTPAQGDVDSVFAPGLMAFKAASFAHQKWPALHALQLAYQDVPEKRQTVQGGLSNAPQTSTLLSGAFFENEILSLSKHTWEAAPFEGGLAAFPPHTAAQLFRASWRSMADLFTTPVGFLVLLLTLSLPFLPAPPVGRIFLPLRTR